MNYLNRELLSRLDELSPINKKLLTQFLIDIGDSKLDSEKKDAVTGLRSRIREYVSREENL